MTCLHLRTIILITPFYQTRRGNSITTARLAHGLKTQNIPVKIISLETPYWETELKNTLAHQPVSLIHGFNAHYLAQVFEKVPETLQYPLVVTLTGTDIHYDLPGKNRSKILSTLSNTERIIVFHNDFIDFIRAHSPLIAAKVWAIPQGINLPDASPIERSTIGIDADDTVFLLPSGLRPVKNINLALKALNFLYSHYKRLRLLIIGAPIDPAYSQTIHAEINRLPWVHYLDNIPHEQMASYLKIGHVVLNTSLAEGQPQGALEAMSLGIPAILSAIPGNLNIMENGKHGFYIDDENKLIKAAQYMLDNPDKRRQMGQACRQLVLERFSPEYELREHIRLYQSLFKQNQVI